MSRPQPILPVAVLLALGCGAVACGDGTTEPPPTDPPRATTVEVAPATVELTALGETARFTARVLDQNGQAMAGAAVAWSSSDASVATVDGTGLATAAGNGTVTVTAAAGAASGSASVAVAQVVGSVALSPSAGTLAEGDTLRFSAEAADANGHPVDGAGLQWASSDTAVAVVDDSGLATGVSAGVTEITATASGVAGGAALSVVAPNPDRAALVALYNATAGPRWLNSDNWLTDAPLGDWYGVTTDDSGRVVRIRLRGNGLSGPIPGQLGQLASLESLDLNYNVRPGPFGEIALSGTIPPELGNLANLTELRLRGGELSGPIPPELGDLGALTVLTLGMNDLTGPIPSELGGLASVKVLSLGENDLSGPIPSELGGLANLEALHLGDNALSGPVPPEFGGMASLRELGLSNNAGMKGPLPVGMTDLHTVDVLLAGGTGLCAPTDPGFQAWLAGMQIHRIMVCLDGDLPTAYLTQAVQSREFPVPLVAGEKALLRVFPTARRATSAGIPAARARFYRDDREIHVENIPGKSASIPTEVDESRLSKSANAEIPGRVIQPGLEMVIEVDPDGTLDPALAVAKRIPETGRLEIDVRAMPLFDLTLVPFVWSQTQDSSIVGLLGAMAADPENHEMLKDTRTLLPVGELDVTAHEPVLSSSNNASDLVAQTQAVRAMEGGTGHYVGMMGDPVTGPKGLASRPGWVSFSVSDARIMAHELGHNLGLQHTPGAGSNPDWNYPYPDQTIGVWGYDFDDGGKLVPPDWYDLMSYSLPSWVSDYHFSKALRYRHAAGDASRTTASSGAESLLLWGGIGADGLPYLEPVFVVDAPAALPDSAGEYRVTGRAAGGQELFSFSFGMPETAHGDGRPSFAVVLPVRVGWKETLARITLAGPGGSVALDGESDLPMVIQRDLRTGRVRGFLRDPPQPTPVAMDAARQAGAGRGLAVLFSRGIPDASAWHRR